VTLSPGGHALAAAPLLAMALFLGPVVAGLVGTLLPALGGLRLDLAPWRALLAAPELAKALTLTLATGVGSSLGALLAAVLLVAGLHARPVFRALRPTLWPLLAVPHLATAVGLAFLLAPSGWAARLLAPLAGWGRPPDLATVNDPAGLALTLGLVVKETPFLALALLAAAAQIEAPRQLRLARSLGYRPAEAWLKVLLPQLYPQIRLPIWAVLAYGLSVVDMAIVLGPATPPPLAPLLWRWLNDPDLSLRAMASAAAMLLLLVMLAVIAVWHGGERLVAALARHRLSEGAGRRLDGAIRLAGTLSALLVLGLGVLSLVALLVWSLAGRWPFPDLLPAGWTLAAWVRALAGLARPLLTTLALALATAAVALALVVACLEHEAAHGTALRARVLRLAYLPLLVPQLAFLFGFAVLLVWLRIDGTHLGVAWAHLVFVLPYVLLMLRDPWLALDPRYARTARALGRGPVAVLFRVKMPLLLRPLLLAAAIGVAVSVAQYLPTLFAGGGRVPTLATETLAMALAGDRRAAAVAGLLLALLPLLALGLATAIPAWRARHRRGLRPHGG
jgi:putative thiamine transport system permease protein